MLKFSFGNSKLNALKKYIGYKGKTVACFDLPAGYTCPNANICKTFANKETGKLVRVGRVLCYAAKIEAVYKSVRALHWHNFDLLKGLSTDETVQLILKSWDEKIKILRIHSSGDFFNDKYFWAWVKVATLKPDVTIFGYTKILNYAMLPNVTDGLIPDNFHLQYSYGSTDDENYLALDVKPSTCFVGEFDGQYPYKVVCSSKDLAHEDYFSILNGETFQIGMH